jgi:hypothetical protein
MMGLEVSRKGDKYRIWSTIGDGWRTDWVDRKGAIRFIHDEALYGFKLEMIKKYFSFPHGSIDHDGSRKKYIMNLEEYAKYTQWFEEMMLKPVEEHERIVNETYHRIVQELEGE